VLLFLCWPLSRWRFAIVAAMGVGFIGACVLLGPLFGLSPLSGRAWTLLGVFAAATPALMCLFVFLVSRVKQRLRRSQRAKHAAGLSATLS
jgi:cation-transporting ATPase E